jgi:ABC-2 type transport system permease protein
MTRLTVTELKLFLREPSAVFFVLVLPVLLLAVFGVIPASHKPDPALGGHSAIGSLIPPIAVSVSVAVLALSLLPTFLATYRERGILRRLGTTPVHPARLLAAQVAVHFAMAVAAAGLVVGVGYAAFGVAAPRRAAGFVLSFVLIALSMLAVGVLIAAVCASSRAATTVGFLLFFPSMFLAGVYVPREQLPPVLRHVGEYTPTGAGLQALRDSWTGGGPHPLHLAIMAAYATVAGLAAAKIFRWE